MALIQSALGSQIVCGRACPSRQEQIKQRGAVLASPSGGAGPWRPSWSAGQIGCSVAYYALSALNPDRECQTTSCRRTMKLSLLHGMFIASWAHPLSDLGYLHVVKRAMPDECLRLATSTCGICWINPSISTNAHSFARHRWGEIREARGAGICWQQA